MQYDKFKNAVDMFESYETVRQFKEFVDGLDKQYKFSIDSLWQFMLENANSKFSVKMVEYYGCECWRVRAEKSLDQGYFLCANPMPAEKANTLETTLNLMASVYSDTERLFKITSGLYKSLREATFEMCHNCDEMDDKVPDADAMPYACQKSGEHTGCFCMKWRQALSNAKHLFEKDLRFLVVKTSDTPVRIVIDADTVARFDNLESALAFVKEDSDKLESDRKSTYSNYPFGDKFVVVKQISDDGRLTVVSYGRRIPVPKVRHTVWRVIELPPRVDPTT